jgi:hypothetical protein
VAETVRLTRVSKITNCDLRDSGYWPPAAALAVLNAVGKVASKLESFSNDRHSADFDADVSPDCTANKPQRG